MDQSNRKYSRLSVPLLCHIRTINRLFCVFCARTVYRRPTWRRSRRLDRLAGTYPPSQENVAGVTVHVGLDIPSPARREQPGESCRTLYAGESRAFGTPVFAFKKNAVERAEPESVQTLTMCSDLGLTTFPHSRGTTVEDRSGVSETVAESKSKLRMTTQNK